MNKAPKRITGALLAVVAAASLSMAAQADEAKTKKWDDLFAAGKLDAAKGDNAKAETELKEALSQVEKAKDEQAIAEVANELANLYLGQGDVLKATEMAKKAKDSALSVLMKDPKTAPLAQQLARNEENGAVWINHMMKAEFACDKKDYAVAATEYQAACEKAKEYASDGMPMATALGGLGKALVEQGKFQDAEPVLRQAIDLCKKNWTPVTKQTALDAADAMDRLALVLDKTGHHDESVKIAAQGKQVRETKNLKDL